MWETDEMALYMAGSLLSTKSQGAARSKVKGLDIYIPPLTGKPEQQRCTIEVAYRPALAVGGAAQLAAAHFPNERILDPQSAARQTHFVPQPAALGLCSAATTTHCIASITIISTHLATPDGW